MAARYQYGTMKKSPRKSGAVWEFYWREPGKGQKHIVVGPVKKYPTEREAQRQVEHIRLRINGEVPLPAIPTFGAVVKHYMAKEVDTTAESPRLAYPTRSIYRTYINGWIMPRWENQKLDSLLAVSVEEWLLDLKDEDGRKMSAGTKAKIRNIMSGIYSHAIRHGWIKHNPVSEVRQSAKRESIPDVLTAEELLALMGRLSVRETALAVLLMFTGVRSAELLALKWSDFEFEKMEFWVRRSIYHQQIGDCKSEASKRAMPIDAFIKETMLTWQLESTYSNPGDWVFASDTMKGLQPYWPENRRDIIKQAAKDAGIKKNVGFHTFRHTMGTLMKDNGEDIKVIQEMLRHATSRITLESYTQAVSSSKRKAQSKLVEMVIGKKRYMELQEKKGLVV